MVCLLSYTLDLGQTEGVNMVGKDWLSEAKLILIVDYIAWMAVYCWNLIAPHVPCCHICLSLVLELVHVGEQSIVCGLHFNLCK